MVVQRVVKHFVAQESRKHRRLLKRSARLSLTDLVEIAHMRGLEARDPGAEAAPAPEAGEAAPPAQAEAASEQAAEQSEQEGEPQISEHESNEPVSCCSRRRQPGPPGQCVLRINLFLIQFVQRARVAAHLLAPGQSALERRALCISNRNSKCKLHKHIAAGFSQ